MLSTSANAFATSAEFSAHETISCDEENAYLQINGAKQAAFRGKFVGGYLHCSYDKTTNVYFNANKFSGENFWVEYSEYSKVYAVLNQ